MRQGKNIPGRREKNKMSQWKKAWGYVPIDWGTEIGTIGNVTQKLRFRNNINGTKIKIKFTNLYDAQPFVMDHVTVGKWNDKTGKITEVQTVTYQGNRRIKAEAGCSLWSDEIPLSVAASDDLAVSVYWKEAHTFSGICQTWNAGSWKSSFLEGDQADSDGMEGKSAVELLPFLQGDENVCNGVFGICGVQILTEDEVVTMACFGDSITHMSYYFDPLLESLYAAYPGKISLLNCGIGGNRVLYDACYVEEIPGHGKCFGEAGVKRFERDVYEDTVPDIVFLMEGVNDCTHGLAFHVPEEVPDGERLFGGIKRIAETAHNRGSKIYISTVMPFGCYKDSFREEAEKIRQDANALIRGQWAIADGFVDLDEIMRKKEDIHFMKDGTHLGDGVHPNEAGGKMIAEAIENHISTVVNEIKYHTIRQRKES